MMEVNLCGKVFQPHGLGHFMGFDVHDVGKNSQSTQNISAND